MALSNRHRNQSRRWTRWSARTTGFRYVVLPGSGKVAGWQIRDDGSLRKVGEFGGLSQTVNGDQAPVDFGSGGSPAGIAVS